MRGGYDVVEVASERQQHLRHAAAAPAVAMAAEAMRAMRAVGRGKYCQFDAVKWQRARLQCAQKLPVQGLAARALCRSLHEERVFVKGARRAVHCKHLDAMCVFNCRPSKDCITSGVTKALGFPATLFLRC